MRNKVSSKDRIISVAEEIIKRDGINELKVRRISKDTGIAVGTIYNYFSSQEELIEEVFIQSWNNTKIKLSIIINKTIPTKEKLLQFLDQLGEDIIERRGVGEYVLSKILFKSTFANSRLDFFDSVAALIEKIFNESPKHTTTSKEELKTSAQLALIGYLHFNRKNNIDLEVYKKILLEKFI